MRYIGNKTNLLENIKELLKNKNLIDKNLTFFDAFSGTGSVADSLKHSFDLVINDNLTWSVVYSRGRIVKSECSFSNLGYNPFEYLNSNSEIIKGFIYNNYTPANSDRMYFTEINGGRIDYFRTQIQSWKDLNLINDDEYSFLLASLVESVSKVSNTAGVYGVFLKKWDSRALKPIFLEPVDANTQRMKSLKIFNDKIENIISKVDCDILYLDPPYTQNQ